MPVSSDLTAVFFVDERKGWAVGHDGVILHTDDGGETWTLQLDGRTANELLLAAIERKVAAQPTPRRKALLAEAQRNVEQGADKPFLDVWFADANDGYAVGAYNLHLPHATTAARRGSRGSTAPTTRSSSTSTRSVPRPADCSSPAKAGLVLKLDAAAQRFRAVDVPYQGSFFGVAGDERRRARLRPARQRLSQRRRAARRGPRSTRGLPATIVARDTRCRRRLRCSPTSAAASSVSRDGGRTFEHGGAPGDR